jgi:hypothetical protein
MLSLTPCTSGFSFSAQESAWVFLNLMVIYATCLVSFCRPAGSATCAVLALGTSTLYMKFVASLSQRLDPSVVFPESHYECRPLERRSIPASLSFIYATRGQMPLPGCSGGSSGNGYGHSVARRVGARSHLKVNIVASGMSFWTSWTHRLRKESRHKQ